MNILKRLNEIMNISDYQERLNQLNLLGKELGVSITRVVNDGDKRSDETIMIERIHKVIPFYQRKSALLYLIFTLIIAPLIVGIILKYLPDKEKNTTKQTATGNNTSQMATTGDNSPITNIEKQNIYTKTGNLSLVPTLETIRQLGNLSLWTNNGGSRQSYETLLSWGKDETIDPDLKQHIISEIKRVKENYYLFPIRRTIDNEDGRWVGWGWICIVKATPEAEDCARGIEPPKGFDAANVLAHLYKTNLETPWKEYARAACILRNIKTAYNKDNLDNEKFFGRLITLMKKNERSLCVSKMAFETYKELAEFTPKSNDPFAFQEAIDHWKNPENKKALLEKVF